jgi:hypothetical protein
MFYEAYGAGRFLELAIRRDRIVVEPRQLRVVSELFVSTIHGVGSSISIHNVHHLT